MARPGVLFANAVEVRDGARVDARPTAVEDGEALFMGRLVLAGLGLVACAAAVACAYFMSKRQPPLPEEMHRTFATKLELTAIEEAAGENARRLHERIDELKDQTSEGFQGMERALGRIEGTLAGLPQVGPQRSLGGSAGK